MQTPRHRPMSYGETTVVARAYPALTTDDATLAALRAHIVTACAAAGHPVPPVERQNALVAAIFAEWQGPPPKHPDARP